MSQSLEALESRYAGWVTGLILASVSLGLLAMFMGLFEGTVGKALFFGVASLAAGVGARALAQVIHTHIAAANVFLVIALVAFAASLQSAILGTGQQ